jgi:hypothetical protein
VRSNVPREIDTQLFNDLNGDGEQQSDEPFLSFLSITWTDTLGASNVKWTDPATNLEAHVEAVENGTHQIAIANQTGCAVAWCRSTMSIMTSVRRPWPSPFRRTTRMRASTSWSPAR